MRAAEARLSGDRLRTAAFIARTAPKTGYSGYEELMNELLSVSEHDLHSLGRELRRGTLITAIGILDFCLFETLVFMVGTNQGVRANLPRDLSAKQKPEENALTFAERTLKRTGIERRLGLVKELLGVSVADTLLEDLKPLLEKRHAIVHQSKFFEAVLFKESPVMQARPFPEVSYDEAGLAMMTITEIADVVLTGIAKSFFGSELGDLRPLNPALEQFYREMRQKLGEKSAHEPEIEHIENPSWDLFIHDQMVAVVDRTLLVAIRPTSIESLPIAISCIKHNVHGEKLYMTVDHEKKKEVDTLMKPCFLEQLLNGKSLLIEYQNVESDVPKFALFSLDGFRGAWQKAVAAKNG